MHGMDDQPGELKDGKLTGIYQRPFGEAPISQGTFKDDAVAFEVEGDLNGTKFVIKIRRQT